MVRLHARCLQMHGPCLVCFNDIQITHCRELHQPTAAVCAVFCVQSGGLYNAQACWRLTTQPSWPPGWRWAASHRGECTKKCDGTRLNEPATTARAWWSFTCSCATGSGAFLPSTCRSPTASPNHYLKSAPSTSSRAAWPTTRAGDLMRHCSGNKHDCAASRVTSVQAILPEARGPRVLGARHHGRAARVAEGACRV
jgi:hypothetical protein